MGHKRIFKLFVSLCVKGAFCLTCSADVGFAQVNCTNSVTISPSRQLNIEQSSAFRTVYADEIPQARYCPAV